MKVKMKDENLIITLPLKEPRPSRSGKKLLVATSRGPRPTGVRVDGKVVAVVAHAFIDRDEPVAAKPQPPIGKRRK